MGPEERDKWEPGLLGLKRVVRPGGPDLGVWGSRGWGSGLLGLGKKGLGAGLLGQRAEVLEMRRLETQTLVSKRRKSSKPELFGIRGWGWILHLWIWAKRRLGSLITGSRGLLRSERGGAGPRIMCSAKKGTEPKLPDL